MTKANLRGEGAVNGVSIGLGAIVRDALQDHFGSLKAAAISLQMDLGQLSRELSTGDFKLKRLELDPEAQREVLAALYEAVRDDPRAMALRKIHRIKRDLDELAEAING